MTLALALPQTETFVDWSNIGARLCTTTRNVAWLIGEWLDDGVTRFGEKARDEANRVFRTDVARLGPILDVYRAFPTDRRHDALTFSHHQAVMQISDPQARDLLLTEAESEGMTVATFRAHVKVETGKRQLRLTNDHQRFENDDLEDIQLGEGVRWWNLMTRSIRQEFMELAEEAELGVIVR